MTETLSGGQRRPADQRLARQRQAAHGSGRNGVAMMEPWTPGLWRDQGLAHPDRDDAGVGRHAADDGGLMQMMAGRVHNHIEAARRAQAVTTFGAPQNLRHAAMKARFSGVAISCR